MRTILLSFGMSLAVSGAELGWPQFRGPEANPVGAHPRLADRWSKSENVEWVAEIPGRGWSSPVVTGGKVFLTTVTTEGKSKQPQTGTEYSNQYVAELVKQGLTQAQVLERVTERDIELPKEVKLHYFLYCLDLKSGGVEWKKEFYSGQPPGGRHRKNSFTSETPVTDGKSVFVYVANLGMYAFDLKGKPLWTTALDANPIYLDFGTGGSPVLHENQLIVLSDNEKQQFLASFDKRTGTLVWRTDRDIKESGGGQARRSGWTTPFVWVNPLRKEIVTIGPAFAVSYDLAGTELWRLGGMASVPVPSPFSYDGLLYIDAGMGKGLFAVRPGAKGDISLSKADKSNEYVAWSDARGGTYLPTPVAYRGGIYSLTETGILSRFDAKSGKLSYKSRLDSEAGYFTSSPWAYNGKLFCLSEEGKTFVVAAGETFRLLHVNSLEEMAQATPAMVGERLLLRTETRLYSIRQNAP
ncbi:MAG: PQQ-binding-like beta-propeller repeat protein [Bryobacteraceae bacterium]